MANIKWGNWFNDSADLSELVGEELVSVTGLTAHSEEVVFICASGKAFKLYHDQDCCEHVTLDDFEADVTDWRKAVVLSAEEVSGEAPAFDDEWVDSYTWTFYKIETTLGGLWLRWYGQSNGYYSERVDFMRGEVQP